MSGTRLILDGVGPDNTPVHYEYDNDIKAALVSAPPLGQFLAPSATGGAATPIVPGVPFAYPAACVPVALLACTYVLSLLTLLAVFVFAGLTMYSSSGCRATRRCLRRATRRTRTSCT